MNKDKKQETIFVLIAIIFVSIIAGLKFELGFSKTLIVIVAFVGLYLVINYLLNKLFAPLYSKRSTKTKGTTLVGKPKSKKR